jgi:hypothetical protein
MQYSKSKSTMTMMEFLVVGVDISLFAAVFAVFATAMLLVLLLF